MSQVPSLKKLLAEDFKEQAGWIGKLIAPINDFFSRTVSALNNDLTFSENLRAQIQIIDFNNSATGAYPVKFKTKFSIKPIGLWIVNVQEIAANPGVITSAVWADWSFKDGQISINNFSGLTVGKRYNVTLLVSFG